MADGINITLLAQGFAADGLAPHGVADDIIVQGAVFFLQPLGLEREDILGIILCNAALTRDGADHFLDNPYRRLHPPASIIMSFVISSK